MSPRKSGTAVTVRDGVIIHVGEREELLARFKDSAGLVVDETFADKVLTPGLIDPHLHFWLFALVANAHFITPADWQLPWGDVQGVVGEHASSASRRSKPAWKTRTSCYSPGGTTRLFTGS